jgi:hypothetical protein
MVRTERRVRVKTRVSNRSSQRKQLDRPQRKSNCGQNREPFRPLEPSTLRRSAWRIAISEWKNGFIESATAVSNKIDAAVYRLLRWWVSTQQRRRLWTNIARPGPLRISAGRSKKVLAASPGTCRPRLRAKPSRCRLGTTADPRELDEIVSRLEKHLGVENASWSLRTTE